MEERGSALRRLAAAALIAAAPAAFACDPGLEGPRLESPRYVLAFAPARPPLGEHFSLDVAACAKPGHPSPDALRVDAHMPEHRHGMNYRPSVIQESAGRWRAEGLMLHMQGRWDLVFELRGGGAIDRLAHRLELHSLLEFDADERARILAHGPWPPSAKADPSNRVSGKPQAIALGERLFFDPRLSGTGSVLCATCHAPFRAWQDARARAVGLAPVDRNTPTLLNVRFNRWLGWDGAHDSLWAQSLRPLLDEREMASSARQVAEALRRHYAREYAAAFGSAPGADDEALLVDAAKALAAFQETLVSGPTAFDAFRDALARGDRAAAASYPLSAQRGLRIFVGKGNCSVCHFGPQFTNGEFADIGVGFFVAPGRVDSGRHGGIAKLKASPFNRLGRFSDEPGRRSGTGTRHVEAQHRNFGEFRVPGLRNVARTAPYMHNGSLATLRDVVKYYSELNEERLHADGEKILRPLRLSDSEIDDLVSFLESL